MAKELPKINFFVVYVKTRKKFDKYVKNNQLRNKYVIDVKKLIDDEMEGEDDRIFLKILIFNKIQRAIERGRDIYYIPNFDEDFSIEKLMNLKKILGKNNFNILLFYEEFKKNPHIMDEAIDNISKFSNSQIIRDY